MKHYGKGDAVKWNWGKGEGSGHVKDIFTSRVERVIKGTEVVRNASESNPAYLIRQDDGDEVLKSGEELKPA